MAKVVIKFEDTDLTMGAFDMNIESDPPIPNTDETMGDTTSAQMAAMHAFESVLQAMKQNGIDPTFSEVED